MQKPYIAANVKKLNMNNKQLVRVLRDEHREPSFVENQNRITIQIYFQLTVEWHLSIVLSVTMVLPIWLHRIFILQTFLLRINFQLRRREI
jgi:hypothetical protein